MTTEALAAPPATEAVVVRVLPPEEYYLLQGVGLFEQFNLPDMQHTVAIVGQNPTTGKIVAYWLLFDAVHVEPLWIDEAYRKKPGLGRRLWSGVLKTLIEKQVRVAFACIGDGDLAQNLPQASRLGFQKLQGSLFFVEVKPEAGAAEAEGWKSATDQVKEILGG